MLRQAGALGLLAGACLAWPGDLARIRLERALRLVRVGAPAGAGDGRWAVRRMPRSRWLRIVLGSGAVGVLSQFVALPVALAAVALVGTACSAWIRSRRDRALRAEEEAALEGLGILVAELRAGRAPEDALATAGRHCGHPAVGAMLSSLSRSMRMGGLGGLGSLTLHVGSDQSTWRARLIAGVRLSSRTGCALAEVIAAVEADLRGLGHRRADLRASAAGHRATVALLAGLPILGLAMGSGIGAEPLRILTTTPLGHVLLLSGLTLELLGLAWSRRLVGRALREG